MKRTKTNPNYLNLSELPFMQKPKTMVIESFRSPLFTIISLIKRTTLYLNYLLSFF